MKISKFIFHRDHLIITAGAFLLLYILSFSTRNISFLNPVAKALDAFSVSDIFFEIAHSGRESEISDAITIVDMTDQYKRGDIAMTLEEINACNPSCIGVDLIFEGAKDDASGDETLTETARAISDKSVFAYKLTDYNSDTDSFSNAVHSFFTGTVNQSEGYVNFKNNLDSSPIRELSTSRMNNGEDVSSFSARLACLYAGRELDFRKKDLLINYRNVTFPVVSFDEILGNQDLIEGRVVLVGTVNEERDMHNSPLGKMPGVMIQAFSVDSLLGGDGMTAPKWIVWILSFILCYLFQVSLEAVVRFTTRKKDSISSTFSAEARSQGGIVFFIWSALLCYIFYIIFVRWQICVEGAVILAILALALESRKLYRALIIALSKKYHSRLIINSIYIRGRI